MKICMKKKEKLLHVFAAKAKKKIDIFLYNYKTSVQLKLCNSVGAFTREIVHVR